MSKKKIYKSGFVTLIGRPNVGKSTLMNHLIGQKIAITSEKPQTTRTKIMGVLTLGETQLVFTDTPGYHRPKTKLGEKMIKAVGDGIAGVDACLFVTEPEGEIKEAEGDTDIFIYPGYEFKCIDCLITNFHLPESTLIMLVSAFCGYENTMNAYKLAVEEKYRFFSFGDACLICE